MRKITDEPRIDKRLVRKHFNRHAEEYDRYAGIQRCMAEKLLSIIRNHMNGGPPGRILEIGCGTGNLTKRLLRSYPSAKYVQIELSDSMIARARENLGGAAQAIDFIAGDAEMVIRQTEKYASLREPFHLVISNAAFQWFDQTGQTIGHILRHMAAGGILAFSTFAPRTFNELHASFQAAEEQLNLPRVRHGQLFYNQKEWRQLFAGYEGKFQWREEVKMLDYPNVREFLQSVKKMGASNASATKDARAYVGRKLIAAMEQYYARQFATPLGIRATYHLGYGLFKWGGGF